MAIKRFAAKQGVPWKVGGLVDPNAAQPVPADGPFMVEFQDSDGTRKRLVDADFTDADVGNAPTIEWARVYRWVSLWAVP